MVSHADPVSHTELLEASERGGGKPNGRIIPLGCLENRVYWVRSDDDQEQIIKVYRRGRWTESDLDVEHDFVCELEDRGCAVAAPFDLGDGFTIGHLERDEALLLCCLSAFDGRMRDELTLEQCEYFLGELIGQVHDVGNQFDIAPRDVERPD